MGLHWEPLMTALPGHEAEFVDLFAKLVIAKGARREQLTSWLEKVGEPPFRTIGAPRVGYDAVANEWLRVRLEKSDRAGELAQMLIDMHGYTVLELMPPSEGFPVYSNHISSDALDRYAFHVQLLLDVDVLDPVMRERAQTLMLPAAHAAFAVDLLAVAKTYAATHALQDSVATLREPVFAEGSKDRAGHLAFSAAKWCAYWSGRGYGLALTTDVER